MEHIVQFAIGIDDDAIVKRVTDSAEKQIVAELKNKVEHELYRYDRQWNGGEIKVGLQDWVKKRVDAFFEDNKGEIVERAAYHLADKMSRTKAIKELMVEKVTGEESVAE